MQWPIAKIYVGQKHGEEGVGKDFQDAGGMDGVEVGGLGQGKVCFVLELQNEFGQEGGVQVKLLAGRGACGSRLAPFGEDATGQEGVGAAIVGNDPESRGEGAVYADAEQMGAAGHEVADFLQALVFGGAGVEALPTNERRRNLEQAQAGGAAAFGIANVYAEGVLDAAVLVSIRYFVIHMNSLWHIPYEIVQPALLPVLSPLDYTWDSHPNESGG